MFIVFDLDDTLANNAHRHRILNEKHKNEEAKWDAFFEACDKDIIYPVIAEIFLGLTCPELGHHIEIWTGRSEKVREKTIQWLAGHLPNFLYYNPTVRMRKIGDFRVDTEVKGDWIEEVGKPDLVFDDRNNVVAWWREQGVTCCQVKESNY